MKKIHQIIVKNPVFAGVLLTGTVLLASCEKFLDVKPTNSLVSENAISDALTARALLTATYSSLRSIYSTNELFGFLPGDNVQFGGSQYQNIELDTYSFGVINTSIVGAYRSLYSLINRANWVLTEIPKVTDPALTEEERNNILGEARFIRALAYFNLGKTWGGVQLQLEPTTSLSSIGALKRSTLAETYNRVKDDLTEAERLLREEDATTRNRAQKSSVRALRARVHLYAGEWAEAEQYASQVIANTAKFELVKPYSAFFAGPFLTKESVFEISSTANNTANRWSIWYPATVARGGSYEYIPTGEIVDLLNNPNIGGTRKSLISVSGGSTYYVVLYHTTVATANVPANTDPLYAIRIAELYLIRAEARAKKTPTDLPGAIADLNAIRDRAEVPLFATTTDAQAVIQAIEDERRVEFAFEGHRWYDLVRTGRAKAVLGVDEDYWLFPLPNADVLSDEGLDGKNNPGY
ncbi:MAG: RagB/SusD family nutrient uptake outer membrane protein [Bacteroidales bacterium]|jgi:hypothetical protein|nr:RagB/SusD family nutrient uptake outer membrane protein [Bacteroidales bacterium]